MFWFAVWLLWQIFRGLVKVLKWSYLAVVYWGGLFVLVHEKFHLWAARFVGARCLSFGYDADDQQYSLEFEASPRQLLVINTAPILLAPPAYAFFYYSFRVEFLYSLLLFALGLGFGMASLLSFQDSASVLLSASLFQPISSLFGVVIHLPFAVVNSPSLLLDEYPFVAQIAFSVFLALLASPFPVQSFLATHGVPL